MKPTTFRAPQHITAAITVVFLLLAFTPPQPRVFFTSKAGVDALAEAIEVELSRQGLPGASVADIHKTSEIENEVVLTLRSDQKLGCNHGPGAFRKEMQPVLEKFRAALENRLNLPVSMRGP